VLRLSTPVAFDGVVEVEERTKAPFLGPGHVVDPTWFASG